MERSVWNTVQLVLLSIAMTFTVLHGMSSAVDAQADSLLPSLSINAETAGNLG